MNKPAFDPGLTQQYKGVLNRVINRDGQFNVRRVGTTWRDANPFLYLISTTWTKFVLVVGLGYLVVNTIFALLYVAVGSENLRSSEPPTDWGGFATAFFFSAHTLTTVGYGNIWPRGGAANIIAVAESFVGVLGFAIATGVVYGRFSRPSARVGFSENALVAPYQNGRSLQFRVVNRRTNNLTDLEARLLLMTVEDTDGRPIRKYLSLELERPTILFFPLTWTVVHPIDERSPLLGKTREDLAALQAELLVTLKAFDETFGQDVHARYSYRFDEILWGAKFAPAFQVDQEGNLEVEVNRVGVTEPAQLTGVQLH
ncbi:MAG: hypothetical protein JO108_07065 [Acidobacteriaceae bacterium]|nr:hypothetical protein [Acidobacteriaceae bacterium]